MELGRVWVGLVGLCCALGCDTKPKESPAPVSSAAQQPASPATPPAADPIEPSDERVEACSMKLTGAVEKAIVGRVSLNPLEKPNGSTSVVTHHWLTEAQRERNRSALERVSGKKKSPTDLTLTDFVLNCGDESGSVSFIPYRLQVADFPSGPGSFEVLPNRSPDKPKGLQVVINAGSGGDLFQAVSGKLVITHFDQRHIEGTFQVTAVGSFKKQELQIAGTFDYPCESSVGDACKRK